MMPQLHAGNLRAAGAHVRELPAGPLTERQLLAAGHRQQGCWSCCWQHRTAHVRIPACMMAARHDAITHARAVYAHMRMYRMCRFGFQIVHYGHYITVEFSAGLRMVV